MEEKKGLPDIFYTLIPIRNYLEENFYHAFFGYECTTGNMFHPEKIYEQLSPKAPLYVPKFAILPIEGEWRAYVNRNGQVYERMFYRDDDIAQLFAYCQENVRGQLIWLFSGNEIKGIEENV